VNSAYSLPGLPLPVARGIARNYRSLSITELEKAAALEHEAAIEAHSRLPTLAAEELRQLQQSLTAIARRAGYPDQTGAAANRKLDFSAGVYLRTHLRVSDTDLLRAETWAFISTVVAPHVVQWRFPRHDEERFSGPLVRNALSRTWLAARLLDRGGDTADRWLYLANAQADFLVQLIERASLSSDRRIALAIADIWNEWRQQIGYTELEALNRSALKWLTFMLSTVEASLLSDTELRELVENAYARMREVQLAT